MANQPPMLAQSAQGGQHPAEQQLLQAGAQPAHLAQARAMGLNPQTILSVLVRLIPALLAAVQELQGQQGGQQQAAP